MKAKMYLQCNDARKQFLRVYRLPMQRTAQQCRLNDGVSIARLPEKRENICPPCSVRNIIADEETFFAGLSGYFPCGASERSRNTPAHHPRVAATQSFSVLAQ